MFDITKKVDIESGKTTYSRTIGEHTASCVASCEQEAKNKLGSDLLCALGLDGIIAAVEARVTTAAAKVMQEKEQSLQTEIEALRQHLLVEQHKTWWQKLGASVWSR